MVWFCCLLCCLFICLWVCCFPAWFFLWCCVVIYLSAFVICFCGYSFFLSLLFIFHWVFLFVYFCGYSFASFVCVCVYLLYICFCCFLCGYYLFICVYLLVCFCKKNFTCTCLFVWLYWCLKPVLIFFFLTCYQAGSLCKWNTSLKQINEHLVMIVVLTHTHDTLDLIEVCL